MRFQPGLPVIHELADGFDEVPILFGTVDGEMNNGMLRVGLLSGGYGPLKGIGTAGQGKAHAMAQILAVRKERPPHAEDFAARLGVAEHLFDGGTPARQIADGQTALQIGHRGGNDRRGKEFHGHILIGNRVARTR
jgi:hypothetical protein